MQWKIKGHGPQFAGYGIADEKGRSICAFPSTQHRTPEEKAAIARLIVAAPAMRDALRAIVRDRAAWVGLTSEQLDNARAALALADGEV